MPTFYITQDGLGTADGSTAANAMSLADANANTYSMAASDTAYLIGTFTGAFTIPVSGLTVDGSYNGDTAIFSTNSNTNGIIMGNRSTVTVQNLIIENCKNGVTITAQTSNQSDVTIDNVTVNNPAQVGILLQTPNTLASYGTMTNFVFSNCTVNTAQYHGIAMIGRIINCQISNCTVNGAAYSGNYWGLYMSPHGIFSSATGWTNGTGNNWTKTLTAMGLTGSPTIASVIFEGSQPSHLTQGTYGALSANEWGQSGDTIEINVATSPNSGVTTGVITGDTSGCKIVDSFAYNVSDNSGTTDGVGIGFDQGVKDCTIERCWSENNDGRGFELHWTDSCKIISSISVNSGAWGHHIVGTGSTGNSILHCVADGNTAYTDPAGFRVDDCGSVEQNFTNCIALNSDLGLGNDVDSTNVTDSSNWAYNCTSTGFSSATTTDPQLFSDYQPKPTSPCNRAGLAPDALKRKGYNGRAFKSGNPTIGAFEQRFA